MLGRIQLLSYKKLLLCEMAAQKFLLNLPKSCKKEVIVLEKKPSLSVKQHFWRKMLSQLSNSKPEKYMLGYKAKDRFAFYCPPIWFQHFQ